MLTDVSAVVLAAGRGVRMGGRKLDRPWRGATILGSVLAALGDAGVADVVVVLGHQPERLRPIIAEYGCRAALNTEHERGMLSSVQAGLRALEGVAAALVMPADHPLIAPSTIAAVAACRTAGLVIPTYGGRRGHPIRIAAHLFETVYALDDAVGLRQLRSMVPEEVLCLPVGDAGILADLDTPEEYAAGGPERSSDDPSAP